MSLCVNQGKGGEAPWLLRLFGPFDPLLDYYLQLDPLCYVMYLSDVSARFCVFLFVK